MPHFYGRTAADRMAAALYNTSDQSATTVVLLSAFPSSPSQVESLQLVGGGMAAVLVDHGDFVPATDGEAVTVFVPTPFASGPNTYSAFAWTNDVALDFGFWYSQTPGTAAAVAVFEGDSLAYEDLIVCASLASSKTLLFGTSVGFDQGELVFGSHFL